jgi:minor extracellular serine protease Vpr
VSVSNGGATSNAAQVALSPYAPGLFSLSGTGAGQGAILIANTDIVAAPDRPAERGEFLSIFATGLGPVTNQPASGMPSPSLPVSSTTTVPDVTIGGLPALVIFSGLASGFVGLYQVNVQVPPGAPVGDAIPVQLAIGGVTSNTVTIAVR